MNVEIGAEAALFPEKEYISRIFVAVCEKHNVFFCLVTVCCWEWGAGWCGRRACSCCPSTSSGGASRWRSSPHSAAASGSSSSQSPPTISLCKFITIATYFPAPHRGQGWGESILFCPACPFTDKKENKIFLIYEEILRDRAQSMHIWLTASSYMMNYLRISSYIRKPFLIYDFATDPIWISIHMRKILFSFLSVFAVTALAKRMLPAK